MNDMAMFLFKSGIHFLHIIFAMTHITDMMINSMIGSRAIKNSLKNVFDGKGPVISISVKKQSNDKNVSDEEPTRLTG